MADTQMLNDDLQKMLELAKSQAGVNDVIKLHQDYMDRINRNRTMLRTRRQKDTLITSSSTY